MSWDRMRLDDVKTLVVDGDRTGADILMTMLRGLGFTTLKLADSAAAALSALGTESYDLCLCDAVMSDMAADDFVRAVRRLEPPARFVPLLALTGYADFNKVTALRDAGAHLVMKKPVSPQGLYDRLTWVAKPQRAFVESETYVGPDRRFKMLGPPGGSVGRRATDLSAEIGSAVEPNLSQSEIDSFIKPMRVNAL